MDNSPDTSKSVHLSASAGSGKTRALKDRYLALLDRLDRSGLGIDQAVAITFTDKAAAEIKERVMRDLPQAMLKKVIRGRQDLRISTIHSFCMNLLKRYPLEAGLPPDFGVLDSRDQADKIQKAVEDALEESDQDPSLMEPLGDFTAAELMESVAFLLSIRSRLKRLEIDAGGPEGLVQAVRSGIGTEEAERDLQALLTAAAWRTGLARMAEILQPLGDLYDEGRGREHLLLSGAGDVDAASRIAETLYPLYFTGEGDPRKAPTIPKRAYKAANRREYERAYEEVQSLLGGFRDLSSRLRAGRESLGLLSLYLRAEERYQVAKLREGLLDFDDLEIYAYHLLKSAESADILYWLDRKILHFLVDEFQDTSDIQWAILNKLTEEIFAGMGASKPMPPTLFVVGDEKQSIYRFREANYRLLDNVRRKMEENLPSEAREIRTLNKNFRSAPPVVDSVNRVFAALWGDEYRPAEAERKGHRGSARLIEILPGDPEEERTGPTEGEVLAGEIKAFIEGGTIIYERLKENPPPALSSTPPGAPPWQGGVGGGEPKGGFGGVIQGAAEGPDNGWTTRPAGYGDCAVLLQSRTRLKEYEAALRRKGIPYRVLGGIGFYEEDEIQAMMNVLFFLWNRRDRLSLAAALKSPLFGLSDQDVLDLFTAAEDAGSVLRTKWPAASEMLNTWGRMAGVEPLTGLIRRIIRDTGAYVRFGRENPQAIFNLDKFLDTSREFDRRGYTTLQDFVELVQNIRASEQREATADLNLPGFEGAVNIMTVHKAKGLEFPAVFLPGMNQQPRSVSRGPSAIIEADGRVRMSVKDAENPLYAGMWDREQQELRREHQRLLYVAMTRARDHLVMIGALGGGRSPVKQDTWLNWLRRVIPSSAAAEEDAARIVVSSHPEWQATARPFTPAAAAGSGPSERKPPVTVDGNRILENLAPVPASKTPEWKKATDFLSEDKELYLELAPVPLPGNLSPLVRGSLLHRCLEGLTKGGTCDLSQAAREFPEVEALAGEAKTEFLREADAVLRAVTGRKGLEWIFERRPGSYSELPFLLRKGKDIVSGVIDRVVVEEQKAYVVDYKAILIEHDEALKRWCDHYRPQIRIYCEAVREMFRLEDVEGFLLFLDSARLEKVV